MLCACGSPDDPAVGADESDFTSDGEDDGSGGITPFDLSEVVVGTPKLRFSYDDAPAVDALQVTWTTILSGVDRRFQLQGATPVAGGKPVLYLEFGRGAAPIEKGVYDCAKNEAAVVIVESENVKKLTVVAGAPQRSCKVVIDDVREKGDNATSGRKTSYFDVVGHVEAEVGPREDASAPTKPVRAAFAANVIETVLP